MSWTFIDDACKALGLSKRTIWRRIEDGSLPSKEEGGRRLVLVESENNEQVETKPKTKEERKGISLLTLDLTENFFDLLQEIRERTKTALDLATIFRKGSDREKFEQLANTWIEVLRVIEASHKKVQEPGIRNDELSGLFPKLLKARHEVEILENQRISSLEFDGTILPDEIVEDIKVEKRKRDKLLSIFEETISNLKKIIKNMSQEVEG